MHAKLVSFCACAQFLHRYMMGSFKDTKKNHSRQHLHITSSNSQTNDVFVVMNLFESMCQLAVVAVGATCGKNCLRFAIEDTCL